MSRSLSKNARKPARVKEELLAELKYVKEVPRRWKQRQVTWEEDRGTV